MPGRIAFVPPRFGNQVVGGSEAVSREIAIGLAARGWDVDVLTTCAVSHYTWANELPEGDSGEDGVTVRRFRNQHHVSQAGLRAQLMIQNGVIPTVDEQWTWVSSRFTTPDLYHYLLRHGSEYDAVVFSPYMFWTTTACISTVTANAVVMPCLHDETYARLDVIRPVLADPASVWFLSEPEHQLAHRLGPVSAHHTVTGAGVEVPASYDAEGFRRRHGLRRPFLLYAGRREKGKGWDWLVETFATTINSTGAEVDLLTIGVGDANVPRDLSDRIVDLGFVSDAERNDAFAAALAYVQPSRLESFSRTIMEAWLARTPVLAVGGSDVVGWHLERSGGGLTFDDVIQLGRCIDQLTADAATTTRMAEGGREYVLSEYSWPVVLDRIEDDLRTLSGAPAR